MPSRSGSRAASEAASMRSSRLSLSGLVKTIKIPETAAKPSAEPKSARAQSSRPPSGKDQKGNQSFTPPSRSQSAKPKSEDRSQSAKPKSDDRRNETRQSRSQSKTPEAKSARSSSRREPSKTPQKTSQSERSTNKAKTSSGDPGTERRSSSHRRSSDVPQKKLDHRKGMAGQNEVKKKHRTDLMDDGEMSLMTKSIGERLGQKFSTVRNAFTGCGGGDGEGISRQEMQNICRIVGYSSNDANRYYSTLDDDGSSDLDYGEFKKTFGPWIQPDWALPDFKTLTTTTHDTHSMKAHDSDVAANVEHFDRSEELDFSRKGLDKREYDALCTTIGLAMAQRYPRGGGLDMGAEKPFKCPENVWAAGGGKGMNQAVNMAFRDIDKSGDGSLGKKEIRRFFSMYNYPESLADRFYHEMPRNDDGEVGFKQFSSQFTKHFGHTHDAAADHSSTSNNNAIFNRFILRLCHEPQKKTGKPQWHS